MAGPSRPPPPAAGRDREPRAHRADLPAFRRVRRLRGPALETARYRAWKRDLVVDALRQAGVAAEVDDLVDAHGEGRRRVVLHARRGTHDVLEVGFAARQAHHIVPIDRCPILAPGLAGVLEAAWAIAEALRPAGKPLDIQATATDAGLDIDVRGSGPLTPKLTAALAASPRPTASPASPATAS